MINVIKNLKSLKLSVTFLYSGLQISYSNWFQVKALLMSLRGKKFLTEIIILFYRCHENNHKDFFCIIYTAVGKNNSFQLHRDNVKCNS